MYLNFNIEIALDKILFKKTPSTSSTNDSKNTNKEKKRPNPRIETNTN